MHLFTVILIFTVVVSVSAIKIKQKQEGEGYDGGEYEAYGTTKKDDDVAEDEGRNKLICVVKYLYKPVCGTDGKTYKNIDELNCSNIVRARAGMKAIFIKNEGACPLGFLSDILDTDILGIFETSV